MVAVLVGLGGGLDLLAGSLDELGHVLAFVFAIVDLETDRVGEMALG